MATDLSGRVVKIADGDTITLRADDGTLIKVRLAEIDAPEQGQPYGRRSREALAQLVSGEDVRVVVQDTDSYGRTVGRPYVDDLDVCAEMVRSGSAWAYKKHLTDPVLLTLEDIARDAKRGLWSLPDTDRVPPWQWRWQNRPNPARVADAKCPIKGNINSRGERIYHMPGQENYAATRISETRGERWFCDENEARAAGWRAARS
jgi:endonuclease YncB( thermonuclease family)